MSKSTSKSKKAMFYTSSIFVVVTMFGLLMLASILSTYTEGAQMSDVLSQHISESPQADVVAMEMDVPLEEEIVEADSSEEALEALYIYDALEEELDEYEEYIPETFPLPYGVVLPEVDFDALREINPDIVGWIILEGTPIDLPVVQGEDNVHYLNHLFDGRRSQVGTIFMDAYNRQGFADHNTILHGHNMRNGSMFSVLRRFRSQEFFDANPMAFLLTPDGNYVIRFFAGHTTCVTSQSWRIQFADDAEMEEWIEENRRLSDFESDVEVGASHRMMTLSTCTASSEFRNARYVVIGRLMPIG
ncbi:MAG: class B sortase [Oscillospiraceae bacterium]|nr:class B sortase [Oscillospiraceae bacterium]